MPWFQLSEKRSKAWQDDRFLHFKHFLNVGAAVEDPFAFIAAQKCCLISLANQRFSRRGLIVSSRDKSRLRLRSSGIDMLAVKSICPFRQLPRL